METPSEVHNLRQNRCGNRTRREIGHKASHAGWRKELLWILLRNFIGSSSPHCRDQMFIARTGTLKKSGALSLKQRRFGGCRHQAPRGSHCFFSEKHLLTCCLGKNEKTNQRHLCTCKGPLNNVFNPTHRAHWILPLKVDEFTGGNPHKNRRTPRMPSAQLVPVRLRRMEAMNGPWWRYAGFSPSQSSHSRELISFVRSSSSSFFGAGVGGGRPPL